MRWLRKSLTLHSDNQSKLWNYGSGYCFFNSPSPFWKWMADLIELVGKAGSCFISLVREKKFALHSGILVLGRAGTKTKNKLLKPCGMQNNLLNSPNDRFCLYMILSLLKQALKEEKELLHSKNQDRGRNWTGDILAPGDASYPRLSKKNIVWPWSPIDGNW